MMRTCINTTGNSYIGIKCGIGTSAEPSMNEIRNDERDTWNMRIDTLDIDALP